MRRAAQHSMREACSNPRKTAAVEEGPMPPPVDPVSAAKDHPGRRSLVFGALFSGAFTLIFTWLIWAFTEDFLYALIPGLSMGLILFSMWWFMAHRVQVETREGRLS
jgi:hypothetical protein